MIDTVGTAVFGLEGANVLVALRARVMIELERARFEEFVGLRTRDLAPGQRDGPLDLALRDILKSPSDRDGRSPSSGAA